MDGENFNIYSENLSGIGSPLRHKDSRFSINEDPTKLTKTQDSSVQDSATRESTLKGKGALEKKLILSLNEAKKVCEKVIYTKRAKIIVLRRFSGPPTMTCFSDFMFLYLGNEKQLSDIRFQHVADSLTCMNTSQDFNMRLIENRFNFLIYNSKIYKSLIFNMNIKPKIFHVAMNLVNYIKHIIEAQSDGEDCGMLNPFLHNSGFLQSSSHLTSANLSELEDPQTFMKELYKVSTSIRYMDSDSTQNKLENSRSHHLT